MSKYTVDYFIQKFEPIPDDKWTRGAIQDSITGACCVLGHCGVKNVKDGSELPERDKDYGWLMTDEAYALADLIFKGSVDNLWMLNDGNREWAKEYGETPKERILNKLKEKQTNG